MEFNFSHLTLTAQRVPSDEVALVLTAAGDIYVIARSGASLAMTLSDGEVQTRPQLNRCLDGTEARRHFDFMCESARRLGLGLIYVGPPWRG